MSADARPVVSVLLLIGSVIAVRRDAPVRWAWAAAIPVAVSLTFGGLLTTTVAADGSDCTDPASPIASARALEAVVVLAVVIGLAVWLRASAGSVWLRWPARRWVRWAVFGFLIAGPAALVLGPIVARPFFGDVGYTFAVAALVPALVFAVSNGVMEEVIYRGVLLGWSARVMGVGPAVVGQAIVFGVAHSGSDILALGFPLMLALGVGGLVAGVIAVRTRSLLVPIAVHIGLDLPIYFALSCPA